MLKSDVNLMPGLMVAKRRLLICIVTIVAAMASVLSFAETQGKKSFLWKVSSSTGSVYLMGSIHVAREDMYPLPKNVEDAFDRSDILALEADITAVDPLALQRLIAANGAYSDGDGIEKHVKPETFRLILKWMENNGLQMSQMSRLKPWLLAFTLEAIELKKLGFKAENGIDIYFANKAKGKKKIAELETFDYQFRLLTGFSEKEQELFLFHTLNEIGSFEEVIEGIIGAWSAGDALRMEKYLTKDLEEHPEVFPVYEKLYTRRNGEMTTKIEQYLKSGKRYFVVVGSMHLVGKEGIVERLRAMGYKVEQF